MRLRRSIAAVTIAAALMPMAAMAQTSGTQSQLLSLIEQIRALQEQLQTLIAQRKAEIGQGLGSTTAPHGPMNEIGQMVSTMVSSWHNDSPTGTDESPMMTPGQMGKEMCIEFNRNLGPGSQGDDVKKLQELLAQNPENGFSGPATGYFGPLTARAMAKYQVRMGIANGDQANGNVGPLSRGFFSRACGQGLGQPGAGGDMGQSMMPNHRLVAGPITSINESSLTITNKEGSAVIVHVSATTKILLWVGTTTPPTEGSISSLVAGMQIRAEGTMNADNTMNALHIKAGFPMPDSPTPKVPVNLPGMGGNGMRGMMPNPANAGGALQN